MLKRIQNYKESTYDLGLDVDFNFQFKPGSEWKYNNRYSQLISVLELSSGLDIIGWLQWLFDSRVE